MATNRPQEPGGRSGASSDRPQPAAGGQADVGDIARAVSTSFLILVFGALIQPLVGSILPPSIGQFWLILVAVIAFALAGARCGTAGPVPPLYGAAGAVGAFVLVIPLQFIQGTFDPLYAVYTLVAALVIGAAAGQIRARLSTS